MAERWRVGGKLKRTLYRDEQLVGLVDTAEIAAEIVETMNRVGRLLDEVRPVERDRRRAAESGRERSLDPAPCGCPRTLANTRMTRHTRECSGQQAAERIAADLARVDPYDTTHGGITEP